MEKEIFDLSRLSDEELCGQLLCPDLTTYHCDDEKIKKLILDSKPGGMFVHGMPVEKIKEYTDFANSVCKYPVLVVADGENGPGSVFKHCCELPYPMAWAACGDEGLIERVGELTAQILRKNGINFTLSPLVDINMNPNNPVVNIRAISDHAPTVARLASAHIKGLQKDGFTVCTAKHFPGDGVDDRNQHYCTTVNSLIMEKWDSTFGEVYRESIKSGVSAVMAAHISLPAYQNGDEMTPAIFSSELMTDLLKGKLAFDGCIISDAMSMIGACSFCPLEDMAPGFINAGGDMVLFPSKKDHSYLLDALRSGKISRERAVDAARRIIELKKKARLFEDEAEVLASIEDNLEEKLAELSLEIARRSVKIVRDQNGVLPLKLKRGDRVLLVNLYLEPQGQFSEENTEFKVMEAELRKRGYEVDAYHKIHHNKINEILDDYAAVFVNCKVSSEDFYGGSLRLGWRDGIMTFWRGYILRHPNLVFVSCGDPYKLYELPFLKTYINAFSACESTQRAIVELTLGEIEHTAKNPVSLKGYFQREI